MDKWVVLYFDDYEEWEDMRDRFENLGFEFMYGIKVKDEKYTITLTSGFEIIDQWCA